VFTPVRLQMVRQMRFMPALLEEIKLACLPVWIHAPFRESRCLMKTDEKNRWVYCVKHEHEYLYIPKDKTRCPFCESLPPQAAPLADKDWDEAVAEFYETMKNIRASFKLQAAPVSEPTAKIDRNPQGYTIPRDSNFPATFWQGFAMALASVNRSFDNPTIVKSVMDGYGVTVNLLRQADVEGYDLKEIRKCMK
jgi:hypothetical protein